MERRNYVLFVLLLLMAFSCAAPKEDSKDNQKKKEVKVVSDAFYKEKYRPQFHFSPPAHWMNDPNGMVYYEGEYHLFYQHYPENTVWGPMHWGHAVSEDMLHWEHLPIALYPDSLGYIFSGSAVVDWNNSTGFGKDGVPPLVAMYTYHDAEGEKNGTNNFQTQGIAYSNDKGRTWTKYEGNPVIPSPGIRDFRDPKVRWDENLNKWILALAVKDHIAFYDSDDMKTWNHLSDFGQGIGAHGGVWECPDLFPMRTGNNSVKWVLFVSINPGALQGGSGTQYFVGDFDGKTFTPDKDGYGWIDYGPDNYAGVTWSDIPAEDGRRLFLGWMSNWQYGQVVPTEKWRSAMTVPRTLTLEAYKTSYLLASHPVDELNLLSAECVEFDTTNLHSSVNLKEGLEDVTTYKLELELDEVTSHSFSLNLSNAEGQKLVFGFDGQNEYFIDRSKAGEAAFSEEFSREYKAPRFVNSNKMSLEIYVDVSSIEVFADGGATCITSLFFPDSPFIGLTFESEGAIIEKLKLCELKSVWNQK